MAKQKSLFTLLSATLESHLSTHAFQLLALIIYALANALMFVWGAHDEFHHHTDANNLRWYICIARGAGYTLNLNTALVILLAARLFATYLRETPLQHILPLDKSFPAFHIVVAYTIAAAVVIHASFHLAWLVAYDMWETGMWGFTMSAATGVVLLVVFIVMFISAMPKYRKKHFRIFYLIHSVGALLFFGLLVFHGMYNRVPETYKWIAAPLIIYTIDRVLRRYKISTAELELTGEHSSLKGSDILELRVPKPFDYQAGQYAEVCVKSINSEWHPFTIASSPHEDSMCFYIKALGDWTTNLRDAFEARVENDLYEPLKVQIRGPFGAPAQHVSGYCRVVLISGGVGSTPFAAICKHLHHLNKSENHSKALESQVSSKRQSQVQWRIRDAISILFDVSLDDSRNDEAANQQRRQQLADMLNMSPKGDVHNVSFKRTQSKRSDDFDAVEDSKQMNFSLCRQDSKSSFNLDDCSDAIRYYNRPSFQFFSSSPRHVINWYEYRTRLLAFLHTTRFTFALLLTLVARIVILCIVSIFNLGHIGLYNSHIDATWVIATNSILGLILGVALLTTILLEISFMRVRFFYRVWRCVDFFIFLPITFLCNISNFASWNGHAQPKFLIFLDLIIVLPIMLLLLCHRMYRSVGSRNLLDDTAECRQGCKCNKTIPDVDFVWTTPRDSDDEWLRNELYPLATGTELRLHRYVTRENMADLEDPERFITTANAGRPQWDEIFAQIAEQTPSHSKIGVFFCGPHPMGAAVQKSMRKVEVMSNLRGSYLRKTESAVLVDDLILRDEGEVKLLREYGCNIRFVFREENFS
uniref:NAD(P)H oxidase n=1 Tax=Asparagopsis taxiformis TaxID=260499 RepID=A0A6M8Q6L6_9FLOR|nr:NAD(P)H oxidase [Asparagopsis taxiformis]